MCPFVLVEIIFAKKAVGLKVELFFSDHSFLRTVC